LQPPRTFLDAGMDRIRNVRGARVISGRCGSQVS